MATKRRRGSSWESIVKRKALLPRPLYLTFASEQEGDQYVRKLEALLDRGLAPEEFAEKWASSSRSKTRPARISPLSMCPPRTNAAWLSSSIGPVRPDYMPSRMNGWSLYGASRLFVNFFQPSFKLVSKQRDGPKVTKRYHSPNTSCERLLQSDSFPMAAKSKLREISVQLDPLKLLEEMRAVQS